MNFFNFDLKKALLIFIAILVPLLLFNMEQKDGGTPWFLRPFTFSAGIIQNGYSSFSSGVRGTTSLYLNLVSISKKNKDLINENAKLRAQLGEMTELNLENERLNKLLVFKQKANMELLAAKVIGLDLISERDAITINRGTKHGVKLNMAVITIGGVVGFIIRTDLTTAQVLLLTDPLASIDALVQRSRARGIVEGKDNDLCELNYLKRGDDAQSGDLIVTSGLDNIFPKGFRIGTITNTKKSQYGVSQKVELEPAVNPNNLEEVFVILNSNNQDFERASEDKNQPTQKQEQAAAS